MANVLSSFVQIGEMRSFLPRVNCDARDTFTTLWRKVFQDLTITHTRSTAGFVAEEVKATKSILKDLPETLTPDDIRRALREVSKGIILVPIFDEFDRIKDQDTATLMADAIKCLSDYSVNATVLVIGVAESVDELIKEHHSIERTLIQIPMPRMSSEEVKAIVASGMTRLKMEVDESEQRTIVGLSQGLPYVTHLLSLHATKSAIRRQSRKLVEEDVRNGITASLENWQQSIKTAYYNATRSHQPGNIFKEVVLACAFAITDEFGYFSAANVRDPLREIVPDREYDIPHFARHLKQISGEERGILLHRTGKKRSVRYRFSSPLMRPYIIMRGFDEGTINKRLLRKLSKEIAGDHLLSGLNGHYSP